MIVLRAKSIAFKVTYIDLTDKPDWFLAISPHGKVPVLSVDDQPLFESNAIAEFLEEMVRPSLHPSNPLKRARNRAWTDYVPDFSDALGKVYYAKSDEGLADAMIGARLGLAKLETALIEERGNNGPYFNGPDLSLVDAAYAPFFQRFAMVEKKLKTGLLANYPTVQAWSGALLANDSIAGSAAPGFTERFIANLNNRGMIAGPLFD